MNYKQLGKSDLKISTIGFGCMSLKSDQGDSERILHEAVDLGINYFDTADIYEKGLNEELVGRALKAKRKDIYIATKVGNQWKKDGSGLNWNPTKDHIIAAVEESLTRLQTDYIDLYQLHGGTINDPFEETIEAFEILQKQGKIRRYGISSIRTNVIEKFVQSSNMVSVMIQYSLLDRRPEETCLPLLQKSNIGVLARGSVAGGLLVNKPAKNYLSYSSAEVSKAAEVIKTVSAKDRNAAQTAIQFVLGNPAITAAVVGIRTAAQLKEAVDAVSAQPLNNQERALLESAVEVNFYTEHR